jgi:hypothetical protein
LTPLNLFTYVIPTAGRALATFFLRIGSVKKGFSPQRPSGQALGQPAVGLVRNDSRCLIFSACRLIQSNTSVFQQLKPDATFLLQPLAIDAGLL